LPDWGADDLTRFLKAVNSNQIANLANFHELYALMRRVNDCFSTAGKNLVNPEPATTGILFLRSQYAYKATVGMALAGQVVEAFVMMRSCLEYAGYALVMFADPTLEEVFLKRHFDDASMKNQKQKFKISEVRAVIDKFDPKVAQIFEKFYARSIDFGAHPNPSAVLSAVQWEANGFLTLALSTDRNMLLHAMKSAAQVGLAALFLFRFIFKDEFDKRGVSHEMELLCQSL
jgi:hypothetical protein